MSLVNNNDRAVQGEKGLSSPQKNEAGCGGKMDERSAATQAPTTTATAWDPYQVWLTRVKQPRDQRARRQSRPAPVESESTTDLSQTARLRALFATLQR